MTETRRKDLIYCLLVALIAFIVYANSLGNGFVWDDTNVIVNNPALQGSPLSLFSSIDTTRDYELLPYYRPLTILTFLIEGRLHGLVPFLMHLFNILLHAANSFLVYLLARTVITDKRMALLAGLVFAVHPLNTESVDFLSSRNIVLSGFFILLSYWVHHRSIKKDNVSSALAGAVLLLAGLYAKETALMVLPLIMAQEILNLRADSSASKFRALGRLLPYAAAVICYLVMRWMTLSPLGLQSSIIPGFGGQKLEGMYKIPDLCTRFADNLYIIPRYLLTVLWPVSLSPRYIIPDSFGPLAMPLAAAWFAIAVVLVWLLTKGRSRASLFGLFWFLIFWLPVSGIIWFPSAPMADRFLYIPAIGLWLVIADQSGRFLLSDKPARRYAIVPALIIVLSLGGLTVRRNMDWKSDVTLFSRVVSQYPDNVYGHAGLGEAFYNRDRQDEQDLALAEVEFEKALSLNPRVPGVHTKLGNIRLTRGDNEGALSYYTTGLGVYPLDKEALLNRGITLENLGRSKEALVDFKRFLAVPGYELADARPYAEARIRELSR